MVAKTFQVSWSRHKGGKAAKAYIFSLSTGLIVGKLNVMLVKSRYNKPIEFIGTLHRPNVYSPPWIVAAGPREPANRRLAKRVRRGIAYETSATTHQHP